MLGMGLLISSCDPAEPDLESNSLALRAGEGGRYIVVLKDGLGEEADTFSARMGISPDRVYRHALKGFAARLTPATLRSLSRSAAVKFIQPDKLVYANAQQLPTGINRIDADLNPIAHIDGIDQPVNVDVAIIDTGIDNTHPELNVVGGRHFYSGFREDANYNDDNGHGSNVAGIAAARDNGVGVVGVAPGARLWAVKVLDKNGSGYLSDVVKGIDWVRQNAGVIDVANMSLGATGSDDGNCGNTNGDAQHLAICNAVAAGTTFVVAAGNDSDNAANHVPAAYDEVITVSALADFDGVRGGKTNQTVHFTSCTEDKDDSFACFSNYGADVDLMAPGVNILSTYKNGGYAIYSGTSQASPHVAGAAALYISKHSTQGSPDTGRPSPATVRLALIASGEPNPCSAQNGQCPDDPDGIQEPLVYLGEAEDSFESYSPGSPAPQEFVSSLTSGSYFTRITSNGGVNASKGLSFGISANSPAYDYVATKFCLAGSTPDYLRANFSITWDAFASWDAIGISGPGDSWVYWWWVAAGGLVFDNTTFASFAPNAWTDVDILIDRPGNLATFSASGTPVHSIALDAGWPSVDPAAPMQCFFVLAHGQDAVHTIGVDNAFIRALP
jgi:subtilisin family serine protease